MRFSYIATALFAAGAANAQIDSAIASLTSAVQLLHRLFIRGVNGPEKLLKVIKACPAAHIFTHSMFF